MSIGYENIFRFPPFSPPSRAFSGEWPDAQRRQSHGKRRAWRHRLGPRAGFWVVALAFLMNMATSTVPTPLYSLYQHRDHFSTFMVTVVFAVYAGGVVASLFLVGHVSDWLGRRRVLATGLLVNVASSLVFIVEPSLVGLIVARVISGLAVGLTTATATSYLTELHLTTHPEVSTRRPLVVAIAVNLGGIGFGTLIAGLLAQFAPAPLVLPYVVVALALSALAALVLATPETVTPVRRRWHPQRAVVPAYSREKYFAATFAGLTAFAVFGVFSSLVPHFLADTIGETSPAIAGATAFAVFAAGAAAQIAWSKLTPLSTLRRGAPVLIVGLLLLATGMSSADLAVFTIGTVITGAGTGLVFRGAMTTAANSARPESRAEAMAGFYLGSYVGLSIPIVGLGVASNFAPAQDVMLVFVLAVALAIWAAVRAVTNEPDGPTNTPHRSLRGTQVPECC